jgi:hypothetical protein
MSATEPDRTSTTIVDAPALHPEPLLLDISARVLLLEAWLMGAAEMPAVPGVK